MKRSGGTHVRVVELLSERFELDHQPILLLNQMRQGLGMLLGCAVAGRSRRIFETVDRRDKVLKMTLHLVDAGFGAVQGDTKEGNPPRVSSPTPV